MKYVPIRGYEGYYSINIEGEVISHFFGIPLKHNQSSDYPRVTLYKPGVRGKRYTLHRLLAEHFIPNPDNLPLVNHIDGNRRNSTIENLEWVTASYNVKDGFNRGRRHPQLGKRYVDRNKICEWCKEIFVYSKRRQRFCSKDCSNAYNRSKIETNRKRDNMGRFTIALHKAGHLNSPEIPDSSNVSREDI